MTVARRKLIVHIGTAKTGTTTLQDTLARSHDQLREHGTAYLRSEGMINARHLASACVGPDGFDDHLDALGLTTPAQRTSFRTEVERSVAAFFDELPDSCEQVIISSEHFHSRLVTNDMVQALATLLTPHASSIRVLCYLRPQVDLLRSLYSTHLRNGGDESLAALCERVGAVDAHYSNYEILLDTWAAAFGTDAIDVRIFDRSSLIGGSIVSDFNHAVGLSNLSLDQPTDPLNESIAAAGQRALRDFNEAAAERPVAPAVAAQCRHDVASAFPGPGQHLDAADQARLVARFAASNEAVRQRFRPDLDHLFASTTDAPPPEAPPTDEQQLVITRAFEAIGAPAGAEPSSPRVGSMLSRIAARVTQRRDHAR